jgi:hypothetical protein
VQPLAGLQLSSVHEFPSLQLTGAPGLQLPPPHTSLAVQALPSLQGWVFGVERHPSNASQASVVQALLSLQFTSWPGLQLPPTHTSPLVQALLSEQGAVLFENTHPVLGLQALSVHGLLSLQVIGAPGWQTPAAHTSPEVHALPSLQGFVLLMLVQPVAGSQLSSVQGLPSSQVGPTPLLH